MERPVTALKEFGIYLCCKRASRLRLQLLKRGSMADSLNRVQGFKLSIQTFSLMSPALKHQNLTMVKRSFFHRNFLWDVDSYQ